jgi:hypothetical protein
MENINEHDFNKLPYQSYYGLDYGLSANYCNCRSSTVMKTILNMNYYTKPMNEMRGSLSDDLLY